MTTPAPPLESYRGLCNAWECDENGHMNVRFYVQRAAEGWVALAHALGVPNSFKARANATFVPVDQHIRFLKEARPGAPLTLLSGVLTAGESSLQVYQELRHADGTVCAAMSSLLIHADPASGRAFPLSRRAGDRHPALACSRPAHGAPRSLDVTRMPSEATMARADAMGVPIIGRGAILASDTDVFGRMRPEIALGRISDSAPNLLSAWRAKAAEEAGAGAANAGAAVVEYRLVYRRWPRAGDGFVVRSAVTDVQEKTMQIAHWMLDPVSGEAWATAEVIALTFDLTTRKTIAPPPAARAALEASMIPAMTL
jgi:acyl-CoA thioester hydrolase